MRVGGRLGVVGGVRWQDGRGEHLAAGAGRERAAPGGAVLDAVLERITYANEETGYTIARVATDRSGRTC